MVITVLWSWASNLIIRTTEEETADVHQRWRLSYDVLNTQKPSQICVTLGVDFYFTVDFLIAMHHTKQLQYFTTYIELWPLCHDVYGTIRLVPNPIPHQKRQRLPYREKTIKDELIQAMSLWMDEQLFDPSLLKEDTNSSQYIQ
jgi:hypothetical protein